MLCMIPYDWNASCVHIQHTAQQQQQQAMRCDAMRCDVMGCDGMGWDGTSAKGCIRVHCVQRRIRHAPEHPSLPASYTYEYDPTTHIDMKTRAVSEHMHHRAVCIHVTHASRHHHVLITCTLIRCCSRMKSLHGMMCLSPVSRATNRCMWHVRSSRDVCCAML